MRFRVFFELKRIRKSSEWGLKFQGRVILKKAMPLPGMPRLVGEWVFTKIPESSDPRNPTSPKSQFPDLDICNHGCKTVKNKISDSRLLETFGTGKFEKVLQSKRHQKVAQRNRGGDTPRTIFAYGYVLNWPFSNLQNLGQYVGVVKVCRECSRTPNRTNIYLKHHQLLQKKHTNEQ